MDEMDKSGGCAVRRSTVTEGLLAERGRLESRLSQVNRAITLLQKNPGVQEALDALSVVANIRL